MNRFYILDEREIWHKAACEAAERAGYQAKRIFSGERVQGPGIGFIRPHADWRQLPQNRKDDLAMRSRLTMIQDRAQIEVYEDKSSQYLRWGELMPTTLVTKHEGMAQEWAEKQKYPLVSKANVGASSVNVRILKTPDEARAHIAGAFGAGIKQHHGANCPDTLQKGYVILQEFIPHKITYRVNAIGNARAVFFRYCYPDKPVAQTGNVEPAMEMTAELESLLDYSDHVFNRIGSKWCALDVLKDGNEWKLLETSLAWPWPSPGRCNEGAIFRSPKGRRWIDMFDVMFDELDAGAWSSGH